MTRPCLSPLLLLTVAPCSVAFVHQASRSTATRLFVGYAPPSPSNSDFDVLRRGRSCADSEQCTLEEAGALLQDILSIQSTCGEQETDSPVCTDVQATAEVVSSLREKLQVSASSSSSSVAASSPASRSLPVFATATAAFLTASLIAANVPVQPDAVPFTPQEVWWAVRDGYVGLLWKEFAQHGGLMTVDGNSDVDIASAFTAQEWAWAMKDGYLGRLASEAWRDGGLVGSGATAEALSPLTPQELVWAAKGGYLSNALASAGLLTDESARPFTVQEWSWAVRDNYLPLLLRAWYANGGM